MPRGSVGEQLFQAGGVLLEQLLRLVGELALGLLLIGLQPLAERGRPRR